MLIPKWKQTLFGNGDSPNGNIEVSLPVSVGDSPYGNGDCSFGGPLSHALKSIFPIFLLRIWDFPVVPYMGNQRTSPYGNGNPHMETGIPVSIWESPFPYRELNVTAPRFYMAITIWKRGFVHPLEIPISIWESPFPYREPADTAPHFHMVITIWKWG